MPGTDTLKLFHDAFGYNSIRFVMILVNLLLDKGHYISACPSILKRGVAPLTDSPFVVMDTMPLTAY